MQKTYDHYLVDLDRGRLTWWDYAVLVPAKHRPAPFLNYWSYLKNKGTSKFIIKKAEWRVEAARKGLTLKI